MHPVEKVTGGNWSAPKKEGLGRCSMRNNLVMKNCCLLLGCEAITLGLCFFIFFLSSATLISWRRLIDCGAFSSKQEAQLRKLERNISAASPFFVCLSTKPGKRNNSTSQAELIKTKASVVNMQLPPSPEK